MMIISKIEEQLNSHKFTIFPTVGNSMEPLLKNRKTHVILEKAGSELTKYDLALYKRPNGQYVLHRIIRVEDSYYYTRGDNRTGLEQVPKEWVIGVVTMIYRNGTYVKVDKRGYLLYVHFWRCIYPIRWLYYKLVGSIRIIQRKKLIGHNLTEKFIH